jgi:hypothetical protein
MHKLNRMIKNGLMFESASPIRHFRDFAIRSRATGFGRDTTGCRSGSGSSSCWWCWLTVAAESCISSSPSFQVPGGQHCSLSKHSPGMRRLARIFHELSTPSADVTPYHGLNSFLRPRSVSTRLRPEERVKSMVWRNLHALATKVHEICGLGVCSVTGTASMGQSSRQGRRTWA